MRCKTNLCNFSWTSVFISENEKDAKTYIVLLQKDQSSQCVDEFGLLTQTKIPWEERLKELSRSGCPWK